MGPFLRPGETNEDLITNMHIRFVQISLPRRDAYGAVVCPRASRTGIGEVPL